MSKKFLTDVDLGLNQLLNAIVQVVATEPAATKGRLIYNSTTNLFGVGNGTAFDYLEDGLDELAIRNIVGGMLGAQSGMTVVYDGATGKLNFTVVANAAAGTPSLRKIGTGSTDVVAGNDSRLTNQRVPSDGSVTDAKVPANAAISADKLVDGTNKVVMVPAERSKLSGIENGATANATDAALRARSSHTGTQPSSTISDFAAAVDARIAIVTGGAPDALDTLKELADALGNDPNFAGTITTRLAAKADIASLKPVATGGRYSDLTNIPKAVFTIGDASATSYVCTHNLNTRDVLVQVYLNSGTYEEVEVDIQRTSVNAVTILFAAAPGAGAYRAVVTA